MTAAAPQASSGNAPPDPVELFRTDGEVSRTGSGWTYQAGSEDEMVYVPFEGMYPNKGGRMQSPWFTLPDTDGWPAYYRLRFKAKTAEHCYWWLDYRGENDQRIPDCNSQVYPGEEIRAYDEVVYAPGAVRKVQIAFVSKGKVEASDVRFATATAAEAAQWCDDLYAALPPLKFVAPPDSMGLLPKTVAAMKNGSPWRVVMLGHSLTNDSFNSLFPALVQRDFPQSRFNVVASVRGSTGCSYYREPEQFANYVVAHRPDLLMIAGSGEPEHAAAVIEMTREQVGCEIVVMSNPFAADWRKNSEGATNWRDLLDKPDYRRFLDSAPARDCARKCNVAFWDMTSPCNDYVASARGVEYNRDSVHSNDVGKQIIGRVLHQYFLTARREN